MNARHRQIVDSDLIDDNKLTEAEKKVNDVVKRNEEIDHNAIEVEAPGVTKKTEELDAEAIYKQYGIEVPVKEEKRIKVEKKQSAADDDFIEMDVKEDK